MNGADRSESTECPDKLICPKCGNSDVFLQVMAEQADLVDSEFNHLHLAYAHVDRYECDKCGAVVWQEAGNE